MWKNSSIGIEKYHLHLLPSPLGATRGCVNWHTHTHTHIHTIYILNKWKILNFPLIFFYFTYLFYSRIDLFSYFLPSSLSRSRCRGSSCPFVKMGNCSAYAFIRFPIPWGKSKWIYAFGPCLIMLSGIHWWWLFIVNRHALNPEWTYSELINPTLITWGVFHERRFNKHWVNAEL